MQTNETLNYIGVDLKKKKHKVIFPGKRAPDILYVYTLNWMRLKNIIQTYTDTNISSKLNKYLVLTLRMV